MTGSDTLSIWNVLGIAETDNERDIKRAYARQLKLNRPEDGAEAFQRLRDAYAQSQLLPEVVRQSTLRFRT